MRAGDLGRVEFFARGGLISPHRLGRTESLARFQPVTAIEGNRQRNLLNGGMPAVEPVVKNENSPGARVPVRDPLRVVLLEQLPVAPGPAFVGLGVAPA